MNGFYPCKGQVKTYPAMTAYHWDGTGKNPNAPVTVCEDHWDEYHDHWKSMWDDYYSMTRGW